MAPFPPSSPFAGLPVPDEVKVNRQVLAEPSADLAGHTWARAGRRHAAGHAGDARGAGAIVLFHVTANADWSNLPLSGLFVDMLRRLVALSAGVAPAADARVAGAGRDAGRLRPAVARRRRPPTGLPADEIARTAASPRHPPGCTGRRTGAAR